MRAPRSRSSRLLAIAFAAGLGVLVAAPGATAAQPLAVKKSTVVRDAKPVPQASAAKKRGKRKAKATTRSTAVPFSSGTIVAGTAGCTGKSHLTGGGFAASPPLTAGGGLGSMSVISYPAGKKDWSASSSAFTTPAGVSGSFTTYARCESNSLGKTTQVNLSADVAPGNITTALLDCPRRAHTLGGGYTGAAPTTLNNATGVQMLILESRRTKIRQWSVVVFGSSPAPVPFTAYVICERDRKGRNVTQASATTSIANDAHSVADASCGGKRHVISGGFAVIDPDPGAATAVALDENHPVGDKGWHVGGWEFPGVSPPPGAVLEAYAYCKKFPKAKKK